MQSVRLTTAKGSQQLHSGHLLVCSQKPRKEKTDQPQKWYCMASSILAAMYKAMNKKMLEMSFISPGPYLKTGRSMRPSQLCV